MWSRAQVSASEVDNIWRFVKLATEALISQCIGARRERILGISTVVGDTGQHGLTWERIGSRVLPASLPICSQSKWAQKRREPVSDESDTGSDLRLWTSVRVGTTGFEPATP
jgi:hypothetical protein